MMPASIPSNTLIGIDALSVVICVLVREGQTHTSVMFAGRSESVFQRTNLAPAELKQDAGGFRLPIVLGMLLGSGQVSFEHEGNLDTVGEETLTGETVPIERFVSIANDATEEKRTVLLVPSTYAAFFEGIDVYLVGSLEGRGLPPRPGRLQAQERLPRRRLRAARPIRRRLQTTARVRSTPIGRR